MKAAAVVTSVALIGAAVAARTPDDDKRDVKTRRIAYDYAACVVKARHDRASAAILANLDNGEIIKRYPDLISSDCLIKAAGGGGAMSFGADSFRYALADGLVRADFMAGGPQDFSDRLPLAHLPEPDPKDRDAALAGVKKASARAKITAWFNKTLMTAVLSRYGECIARADPANARLWLLTTPDVPEELSRIGALRPAFASCLEGGTMTFGRSMMRGLVAINYYRLAMATPQPGLGKTH